MRFSPQIVAASRRFRRQPRAFWSLVVLLLLFLISLPAELLCNSKPLLVGYAGRLYFPIFKTYTEMDFGGRRRAVPQLQGRLR